MFHVKRRVGGKGLGLVLRALGVSFVTGFLALSFVLGSSAKVLADSFTYSFEVVFDQSSARGMLDLINEFRQGPDAWAYNAAGEKVYYTRGALTYDYNLERIAMQRAVEQVVLFGHTRPDGSKWSTMTYGGTKSGGENCAMNWTNVEGAFNQFLETNDDYSGQGHRRAMLGADYNYACIGIAHIEYNGRHYYVQEFGMSNSGAAKTEPKNGKDTCSVNFNSATAAMSISVGMKNKQVELDGSLAVNLTATLKPSSDASGGVQIPDSELTVTWTSQDPSIVKVVDGTLIGEKIGSTTVNVKVVFRGFTKTDSFNVEVTKGKIVEKDIVDIPDQLFSIGGVRPEVTVTRNGKTLVLGTDYTVSYSNNDIGLIGAAYATVKGIGNYTGTCWKEFQIVSKPLSHESISVTVSDTVYCGKEATPEIVIMDGQDEVSKQRFSYSYTDNVNVGTATVLIEATEYSGYEGSLSREFEIAPADLSEDGVVQQFTVWGAVYNGKPITPVPTVRACGTYLKEGTDFTVEYSDNVNAGMASVTITGQGNFTGKFTGQFEIYPLSLEEIEAYIEEIEDQYYHGEPVEPEINVVLGDGTVLVEGEDYSVSYSDNDAIGTAYAYATGMGNYTSKIWRAFEIKAEPTSTPTPTPTPEPDEPTVTPVPGDPTVTPIPGEPTVTPVPGEPTVTPVPGEPTVTPIPGEPTVTPVPGNPTPDPEKEPSIADFIERLYTIALNRESEPEGKAFWVKEIESGNRTGGDCAYFFLIEAEEFRNRGLSDEDFVETLYKTFFDRDSEPNGKAFWVGQLKSGAMTRNQVIMGFIDSKEWCNVCATYGVKSGAPTAKSEIASKNAIGFATRLYTCCLGRDPEDGGLQYWSLALTNLEQTGCSAAKEFFTSQEFINFKLMDYEYVRRLYTTFMDREPENSEISYWTGEIAKGSQTRSSVLAFFGSSEEFTNICKKYGIDRGMI